MLSTLATTSVTSPAPRPAWHKAVAADARCLASQTPEWTQAACMSGGFRDVSRLYTFDDGSRMVLPLLERRGILASLPDGLGIGGLIGAEATPEQMRAVVEDLQGLRALSVRIRPDPLDIDRWANVLPAGAISLPRRAHVLDITGSPEDVFSAFSAKTRRSVRKAERSELEIICDTKGQHLDEFVHLFDLSIARWAEANHEPLAIARWRNRDRPTTSDLRRRATAIDGGFRLWLARKDGNPAAAIVVLVGSVAHHTKGAMDRELAGPTRANHLLQWLAIQDAIASGCTTYHMGDTGTSASLAHFKESFGAQPIDYAEIRFERFPLTRADRGLRTLVKRVVRFEDG